MKPLLNTYLLFLLVIVFSGSVSGQDFEETKRLAEQGNANAQYSLGFMYDEGRGVPENDAESVRWYRLSAEQEYMEAQYALGVMYFRGTGVPENDAEAVRWYRLSAEQGYANAQYNLGIMYDNGRGISENDAQAARWFRLAAEQGIAFAQYALGVMYFGGTGVRQNNVRAYVWLSLATAQGSEPAREGGDIIADRLRLTPEQLALGQNMATRCFESDYQDCERTTLPQHEVASNEPLLPKDGHRVVIHANSNLITKEECASLIDAYRELAAPDGQVSVRKSDKDGNMQPWCVENVDGRGVFFNDYYFN